jgi:hypothetical protein
MRITENIPIEKFNTFHEILCSTGGRYIRNPFKLFTSVEVCYEPGDYEAQLEAWARVNTPIKEVDSSQKWKTILRRLKINFW